MDVRDTQEEIYWEKKEKRLRGKYRRASRFCFFLSFFLFASIAALPCALKAISASPEENNKKTVQNSVARG